MMDFETYVDEYLNEKVFRKAMIRKGKKVFKWVDSRPGYRIQYDKNGNHKSVKIKQKEKRNRHLAQMLHGRIARKAQVKKIELKRKRAFKLRSTIGMSHYDTKNPAKRTDGLFKTTVKKVGKSIKDGASKLLHPAMKRQHESFLDYLENPNILNESPHAFLIDNDTMEVCWDFYSEDSPSTWMEQLVTLYRDHYIDSARPNGNATIDGDVIEHLEFSDDEIKEITANLMFSFEFISVAHHDFNECSRLLRMNLEQYLPAELLAKIKAGK